MTDDAIRPLTHIHLESTPDQVQERIGTLVDRWYSPERDTSWFFRADRIRRDRGRPLGVTDMVEMERDLLRCGYQTPWASQVCGEEVPCPEHAELTCKARGCTNPTTGGCDHCGMLVCGAPVCSEHHFCGKHS